MSDELKPTILTLPNGARVEGTPEQIAEVARLLLVPVLQPWPPGYVMPAPVLYNGFNWSPEPWPAGEVTAAPEWLVIPSHQQ